MIYDDSCVLHCHRVCCLLHAGYAKRMNLNFSCYSLLLQPSQSVYAMRAVLQADVMHLPSRLASCPAQ